MVGALNSINEPLLLINQKSRITCLSNVCTHRGNILCSSSNNSSNITRKYHGRTFNLEGRMISSPGFEGIKKFPSRIDNLNKIKTQVWKNFVLVSLKSKINIDEIFNIEFKNVDFTYKKTGIKILGSKMKGQSIHTLDMSDSDGWCLILGSESHGISESVENFITNTITIPGAKGMESLNVSVAGGILLHALTSLEVVTN